MVEALAELMVFQYIYWRTGTRLMQKFADICDSLHVKRMFLSIWTVVKARDQPTDRGKKLCKIVLNGHFIPSDAHIRNMVLFFLFSGLTTNTNDNQSYEDLREFCKEGATVQSTACNWISKFKDGDYSPEDEERSGRLKVLDLDVLRNQAEADPYQTTRKIPFTLGVNQPTVFRRLKSIGNVRNLAD